MTTRYTNRLNLPSAIVKACTNDSYKRGNSDFSCTELLGPPRIRVLKKLHAAEITEDVSDVLYRLTGSIGHGIIERAGTDTGDIVEKRFTGTFNVDGQSYTVAGQADLVRDNATEPFDIWDWKFASIYSFKDGVKPEYMQQLQILKLLVKMETGIEVRNLFSAAIYRDWSKSAARRESGYPPQQIGVFPVKPWTEAEAINFIAARIRAHVAAETVLPDCTDSERWARPTTYAIKKRGGARAITGGVHTTHEDAERHLASLGTVAYELETRRGQSIRCLDYCAAAPFCEQWKELQKVEAGE